MSRRLLSLTVVGAGAAAGYYLYQSGGDVGVAQKTAERDASSLSSRVKEQLPGSEKQVQKNAELSAEKAGQKLDNAWTSVKSSVAGASKDAEKKLEDTRKETGSALTKAVDKFDSTVEKGTVQAKSGISGWFGGSK